jgi:uncharacterized membrane protein YgcG
VVTLVEQKKNSWALRRVATTLTPDQEAALAALVGSVPGPDETVPLPPKGSPLAAQRMRTFVADSKKAVTQEGLYRGSLGATPWIAQGAFVLVGVLVVLGTFNGDAGVLWFQPAEVPVLWFAALFIGGLAIAGIPVATLSIKPLSAEGAEARDHLLGLRRYIDLAEKDRLAYLQSPQGALREPVDVNTPGEVVKLYERLLPWAVVFGVEKKWMAVLERLYQEKPPTWLQGSRTLSVSAALSSVSAQTRDSFRSSSSSGSGGGGSAGGGGGGGGGGGR